MRVLWCLPRRLSLRLFRLLFRLLVLAPSALVTGRRPLHLGPVIGVLARLTLALLASLVRVAAITPVVTLAPLPPLAMMARPAFFVVAPVVGYAPFRRNAGRLLGDLDGA